MATTLPRSLNHLVQAFTRLPGVGEKTALRYALHLISSKHSALETLGDAIRQAATQLRPCTDCGNIAEAPNGQLDAALCAICLDHSRDPKQICIVASVPDLMALERSGAMRGRYFVLGRLLSPLDGVGPEELNLEPLDHRVDSQGVTELVIATPPSVEGEATALHLGRRFHNRVHVTRIASGIPHGGDLQFADPITLGRALAGRRNLQED